MKENKTFRIPFITKKQLKSRQALHRLFLKPQYKACRGSSIFYFNASFSDVPFSSKMSQPPTQNQQMVLNSVAYHPCTSRIASRPRFHIKVRPKTNNNLNTTKQRLIRRMENQRQIKLPPGNRKMTPTMFLQQLNSPEKQKQQKQRRQTTVETVQPRKL